MRQARAEERREQERAVGAQGNTRKKREGRQKGAKKKKKDKGF